MRNRPKRFYLSLVCVGRKTTRKNNLSSLIGAWVGGSFVCCCGTRCFTFLGPRINGIVQVSSLRVGGVVCSPITCGWVVQQNREFGVRRGCKRSSTSCVVIYYHHFIFGSCNIKQFPRYYFRWNCTREIGCEW